MNIKQQRCVLWGVFIVVLMTIFPPVERTCLRVPGGLQFQEPAGYGFFFTLGRAVTDEEFVGDCLVLAVGIDYRRLLLQWALMALIIAALSLTSFDARRKGSPAPP